MPRAKILIQKEELERLYLREGLSPSAIGARYGCDAVTVRTRIVEAGILLKTKSAAQMRYKKQDFDGSDSEKAYMLGFCYGDLNVYEPKGASETIVVRVHTTLAAQEKVFDRLFRHYGTITLSRNNRSVHMTCYLNHSFKFLLGKYPPVMRRWIHSTEERLWAFAAGYIDAEGTFSLNQGKGRFKIDAYDLAILKDLHKWFLRNGIRSLFRVIARKGANDYGWVWKQDVWRRSVNEALSIGRLITLLRPFLLHSKRVTDANIVTRNIQQRRKHGTVK